MTKLAAATRSLVVERKMPHPPENASGEEAAKGLKTVVTWTLTPVKGGVRVRMGSRASGPKTRPAIRARATAGSGSSAAWNGWPQDWTKNAACAQAIEMAAIGLPSIKLVYWRPVAPRVSAALVRHPRVGRMQGREPCHKASSTKPRRPRGCQTSTSRLFIAVRPKATPNALQSACKRRPPSRHLAVSLRPQIRFYSGCASLRRLGHPGLAPAPPVCRREMSPVFGHLRKAPDLMLRQIVRAPVGCGRRFARIRWSDGDAPSAGAETMPAGRRRRGRSQSLAA